MATALRCTLPGCSCECFNPCKSQLRTCQSCQHGWVAHALDKLASRTLFPSFQFSGIQTSDVFDMASLLLYGAHAVPIRCKIMLDHLFRALNHTDIKQIIEGLGWNESDYMAGYMTQDDEGRLRKSWQQTTNEEELIILNQFLRFSETKSMAEEMICDIQKQKNNKSSLPHTHESNIQAFITNLRESQRQSSEVAASRSVSCTSSDQPMDCRERGLSPMQASIITQSNEHSSSILPSLPNSISHFPLLQSKGRISEYSELNQFPHKKMRPSYIYTPTSTDSRTHLPEAEILRYNRTKERFVPVAYRPNLLPTTIGSVTNTPILHMPSRLTMPTSNTDDFCTPAVPHSVNRDYDPQTSTPAIPHTTSQYKHIPPSVNLPHTKEALSRKIKTKLSFPADDNNKDDSTITKESTNDKSNDFPLTSSNANFQEVDQNLENSWHMSNISKRVLCNICQKWFYDKGTWKIHFGAVHLKVKYNCTVEGCNMTFSSIRSRNRHSSNPNPKIHKSEPVHRKAYTRKQYSEKVPMIELSSNSMKQEGTDSDESGNDEEQNQLSNSMLCENDGENVPKEDSEFHTQLGNFPSTHSKFSLAGLPFSKRYMQALKTEPESNSDESQANKRKSTVPVKYQTPTQESEDMNESGTEDEDRSYSDDTNSISEASTGHKMEVDQHELSASTEDVKPVIIKGQQVVDVDKTDRISPSPDHGYGMTGPLPPTPDSSDHCHEGKASDDFQFNMVSPKDNKKDISSSDCSWPISETIDLKNQEILPGGVIVVDHPSITRKGQGLVCELCSKTYSSKETLKTHYKSIHLGELHSCTVPGCSAMFPSIRSRNRHSQNVKLHTGILDPEIHAPDNTHNLTLGNTHDLTQSNKSNPPFTESIPSY